MMIDYDGGLQAHLVVNFNQDLVYIHCKVQFSYHEYSLCHQNTVYVSPEYSSYPQSTV